jgi:uncharacterized protein YigE (DUF2233 family)
MSDWQKIRGRRAALASMLAAPLLLAGCGREQRATAPAAPRLLPTLIPTQVPSDSGPSLPQQPANPVPPIPEDSGWQIGEAGVALRHVRVPVTAISARVPLTIVRFDPAQTPVRVGYDPAKPRVLRTWFTAEQPILVINGGYFDSDYRSTALVIQDGIASGESYTGFGGMFAVHNDGTVELRPLRDTPYDPSEAITHATQSAPMLLFPGGVAAELQEDGQRARRSVVAIDQHGHMLFIVGPTSGLTLSELASWLASSDLELDRALNLDGGSSTGLFLAHGPLNESIDSFSPLPIVLLAGKQP